MRKGVAVVYRWMPQYRRRFFELLRDRLRQEGIEFQLIYGQPGPRDAIKKDTVELEWAHRIQNRIVRLGELEVHWQPCLRLIKGVDLIIVEQASKLLVNYLLQARYLLGGARLAFWGHGKNFGAYDSRYLAEYLKRRLTKYAHWWFVYNERSAAVVQSLGFPAERTTLTQNAIDTRSLVSAARNVDRSELRGICDALKLTARNLCIYAGAMFPNRRLPFLLQSCELIRREIPDFEVVFIGAGTESPLIARAARQHSWIKHIGPKFDEAKVPYFVLSKLSLMPGAVGLGVLDSFALGVPLVTSAGCGHGPEIDYLENHVNGIVVAEPESMEGYAAAVVELLNNEEKRQLLIAGCRRAAEKYTVENMVERFAGGVRQALEIEQPSV